MARLPTINGDNGAWGTVLNEFLSVAHGTDGNIKSAPATARIRPKRIATTMFTRFQAGHGFFLSGPGTFTDPETSSFVHGSQSVKVTTDGAGGVAFIKKNSISPTLDLTGKMVRVWVRLPVTSDITNIATITLYVSSDNVASNYYQKEFGNLGTPTQRHFISADNDWTGVTFSFGEFTVVGSPNRAAINSFWLRVQDQNGQAIQVQFGGIELVPEPAAGTVSLTFDDGWATQYTNARAKLSQYRYPATTYIIRDLVDTTGYMSLGQIQALHDLHGWDVSAHADTVANHNLSSGFASLSATEIEAEMLEIQAWLMQAGFNGSNHLALPKGEHNSTVYKYARRYFLSTRTTYSLSRETYPPADWNKLRVFNTDNTTTFVQVQTAITRAVANKEWLILVFHDITSGAASASTQMTSTIFNQIVDEIATQGLAVRTVGDVAENGM